MEPTGVAVCLTYSWSSPRHGFFFAWPEHGTAHAIRAAARPEHDTSTGTRADAGTTGGVGHGRWGAGTIIIDNYFIEVLPHP